MQTTQLLIYRYPGVKGLPGAVRTLELLNLPERGIRAFLTLDRDTYIDHLRRLTAIGHSTGPIFAVRGETGLTNRTQIRTSYTDALARTKTQINFFDQEPLLVVERTGSREGDLPANITDYDDCAAGFMLLVQLPLPPSIDDAVLTASAALMLAFNEHATASVEFLGSVAYILRPQDGAPIYSLDIQGTLSVTSIYPVTDEAATDAVRFAQQLDNDDGIRSAYRLLAKSFNTSLDGLEAFLCAWTALEIFLNKLFAQHKDTFLALLKASPKEDLEPLLKRVQRDRVEQGRYSMTDRLAAVSFGLDAAAAPEDIEVFHPIKVFRDKLSHGELFAVTAFPTDAARRLLRKYLRLHLRADA